MENLNKNEEFIEEMTQDETLCDIVIGELIEIKMHICNQRYFEGGVTLGSLINSMIYRKVEEEQKRKKI